MNRIKQDFREICGTRSLTKGRKAVERALLFFLVLEVGLLSLLSRKIATLRLVVSCIMYHVQVIYPSRIHMKNEAFIVCRIRYLHHILRPGERRPPKEAVARQ